MDLSYITHPQIPLPVSPPPPVLTAPPPSSNSIIGQSARRFIHRDKIVEYFPGALRLAPIQSCCTHEELSRWVNEIQMKFTRGWIKSEGQETVIVRGSGQYVVYRDSRTHVRYTVKLMKTRKNGRMEMEERGRGQANVQIMEEIKEFTIADRDRQRVISELLRTDRQEAGGDERARELLIATRQQQFWTVMTFAWDTDLLPYREAGNPAGGPKQQPSCKKTVTHDDLHYSNDSLVNLKKKMTDKYCPRNEMKKLEAELWNLKVIGTDVVKYNQRFQELALLCVRMFPEEAVKLKELMDKRVSTMAERQAENKRKSENTSRSNQNQQQQPNKRQNTGRAYTAGSGDKKPYGGSRPLCSKCNYHHDGPCAPKCYKCNKYGHIAIGTE
ncbi:hypothetical protein Tco_0367556 [Tanacetum coccineum]